MLICKSYSCSTHNVLISLLDSSSSAVFCCTAGFRHTFSVSPSFSVLSCPFECNKATIICQIMQHLNSPSPSCLFTFHSAFSNFMQKSSCLKTRPFHRCFLCLSLATKSQSSSLTLATQSQKLSTTVHSSVSGHYHNFSTNPLNAAVQQFPSRTGTTTYTGTGTSYLSVNFQKLLTTCPQGKPCHREFSNTIL